MTIESDRDLAGLRAVGRVVALALREMRAALRPGMTTAELDAVGAAVFERYGARWMLVRALLNAVIAASYAHALMAGTSRPGRAVGEVIGMSVLTVTDASLAHRLRALEGTRLAVGA